MADIATSAYRRRSLRLSLPLIFGLAVYVPLLFAARAVLGDPDTYWHIAVGRWIIAHREVPRFDVFSFSMPGAPFAPPEWLAELGIAWLYDRFGWGALVAATALSLAAALTMLLRALLRSLMPAQALIATVLATLLVLPHLLARPHVLTLPVLVWWASELVAARGADRAPPLWLVPLMTLWANLHSSYIFGLGLAALLAGEALLAARDRRARRATVRGWGLFIALSVGAAVITPFGLAGLLLPIDLATMSTLGLINEWQSPNFQQFQPLEVWIMAFLLAALSGGWRLPLTRIPMLLLLLHMALRHGRYAELLGLVGPLLLAPALGAQLARRSGHQVSFLDRAMAALAKPAGPLGVALAGAMVLGLSAVALGGGIARDGDAITPAAALAAVAEHHIEGPVLNDYAFGGYLIFSGVAPFIDGRYFYGDAFIKRYAEAVSVASDELPQLLTEYHIAWTLLGAKTPAVVLLDHLPGWRRLYADDIAVVHVRQQAPPARADTRPAASRN
jgi:hypothetical protein